MSLLLQTFAPERAAEWLASRLRDARARLAAEWAAGLVDLPAISTAVLSSRAALAHVPDLIADIADHLTRSDGDGIATDRKAMGRAAELGELRFAQRASVHQLLRDYQMLEDLLHDFVAQQVREVDPTWPTEAVLRVLRRIEHAVAALQRQTVGTFISRFTATIERQNTQLLAFERTVAHEIRQPLSVLQVISQVMPVRAGDVETMNLLVVMERNVAQLAAVAARLERAARHELETDLMPNERTVNLTALVDMVAGRLADAARARGVRIAVDPGLPLLQVDQARTELVFLIVIANAIEHADPAKPTRSVRIEAVPAVASPTVVVKDNGVGMPPKRARHLFRELARAHGHRDQGLDAEGLGLGLSIVRECMDAMGGTVRLESTEGEGTTVTLTWQRRASL